MTPALDLPDWATRAFLIVGAAVFVVVLVLLWFFELTPHGIRLDRGPSALQPEAAQAGP